MTAISRSQKQRRWAPVIFAVFCAFFLLNHCRKTTVSEEKAGDLRGELRSTGRDCYGKSPPRLAKPTRYNPYTVLNIVLVGLLPLSGNIYCNSVLFPLQY